MTDKIIVGLVGTGKLGRAIMKRILRKPELEYVICDEIEEKAKQLAEETACKWASIQETVQVADFLFLALPPVAMDVFAEAHEVDIKENGTIINLSTSIDSTQIQNVLKRQDIEVIGIKPVCQATAMEEGRKVVFFSSSKSEKIYVIQEMLCEAGNVIEEEGMKVQRINEYATVRALELIIQLEKDLEQFDVSEEVRKSAIGSVAVGTLMDYPYTKENVNGYITNLVEKYQLKLY